MIRWFWLACLCAAPAFAEDARPYGLERPTDFTLAFTQHDFDLARGSDRIDTTLKRIGVHWRERYGKHVRLGLLGGYSYLTQTGEPLTAGEQLDGYHAGVSIDFDAPLSSSFSFFAGASYLYERTDDANDLQDVTLSWNVYYAETGIAVAVPGAARFYAGFNYGDLDGDQRARGAVTETRDLSVDDRSGAMGGIEVTLDGDGYAGLVARSGLYGGAGIYFGRRF